MQCLITGASSGIGRALAVRFAQAGADIVGIDRDREGFRLTEDSLHSVGRSARFLHCDLADGDSIRSLLEQLRRLPPSHIIVHCAGTSAVGHFENLAPERQQRVIRVNSIAPMLITAGILKRDLIEPSGTLVFISSLSHYTGYPGAAAYAASKDALASYARSLSVALAPRELHVLTVFPGPTRTPHARRFSPDNSREHLRMAPETVADSIFQAVRRRKRILIPGLQNRAAAMAARVFPRLVERAFEQAVFRKLSAREEPGAWNK